MFTGWVIVGLCSITWSIVVGLVVIMIDVLVVDDDEVVVDLVVVVVVLIIVVLFVVVVVFTVVVGILVVVSSVTIDDVFSDSIGTFTDILSDGNTILVFDPTVVVMAGEVVAVN